MTVGHVQDGAEFRMLSGDHRDGLNVPRRSRTSKVQVHVVTLYAGGRQWGIPTELEAFRDKSALTLATSVERLVRDWCAALLPRWPPLEASASPRRPAEVASPGGQSKLSAPGAQSKFGSRT